MDKDVRDKAGDSITYPGLPGPAGSVQIAPKPRLFAVSAHPATLVRH